MALQRTKTKQTRARAELQESTTDVRVRRVAPPSMKALAVFPSAREVRIVELDRPRIEAPTQVLLRTREVGICGTDREICAFEIGEPPEGADRLVLGHESILEVVETGPGVRTLKSGDFAVPLVRLPCGRPDCYACRAGRQDFCTTGARTRERGIKGADGFMSEWVVDEEEFLVRVPRPLAEVAVLVEPLTISTKVVEQIKVIHTRAPFELAPAAWAGSRGGTGGAPGRHDAGSERLRRVRLFPGASGTASVRLWFGRSARTTSPRKMFPSMPWPMRQGPST